MNGLCPFFISFAHFSTGFLVFLFLISRSSLSIRESGSFSVVLFVKIFHYESNFKVTVFLYVIAFEHNVNDFYFNFIFLVL